jgi:PAS domain S-box-containing protein
MDEQTADILLVEDDQDHVELIRRAFQSNAIAVQLAVVRTLREARARLSRSIPDLVIVDVRLPDGNGMGILPRTKESVRFPTVVLTGHGNEQAAVEAIKRGALDYVVKSAETLSDLPHIAERALREWKYLRERTHIEEQLRENEARYRSLFDDSPLPLWEEDFSEVKKCVDHLRGTGVTDFESYFDRHPEVVRDCVSRVRILDLNQAAVALYKVKTRNQALAGLRPFFTDESYEGFVKELVAIAEGRTRLEFEIVAQSLDGGTIYQILRWAVAPGYEDTYAKVFVSVTDITQRKQAEEALYEACEELELRVRERTAELATANQRLQDEIRRAEARAEEAEEGRRTLDALMEYIPEGVAIADAPHGSIRLMSRYGCMLMGRTQQEVKGADGDRLAQYRTIYRPDGATPVQHEDLPLTRAVQKGEVVWGEELLLERPDGALIPILCNAGPIRDRHGTITGGVSVWRDITERKRTEGRLQRLHAELAHLARVETMGEMASGLAHELNQPLAAILMQAEVAAQKLHEGEVPHRDDLLEMLSFIANEAHRSGEIIRRMRQFVRKTQPERTPLAPAEVIEEVLTLVEGDVKQAGVALTVKIDRQLPRVQADKIQVQQVLLNLIRNALDAMRDTALPSRHLAIQTEVTDGFLATSAIDTGCGISLERMADLFGAFSSTKAGGMGLGLAIARSIVEAHGGRIRAEPNPSRGTKFTFTLPIASKEPKHAD